MDIKDCIDKVTNDLEIINSDWSLNTVLFEKMMWSIPEIENLTLEDFKSILPDAINFIDYSLSFFELSK